MYSEFGLYLMSSDLFSNTSIVVWGITDKYLFWTLIDFDIRMDELWWYDLKMGFFFF